MSRKIQLAFAIVIASIFLTGLFLPYGLWYSYELNPYMEHRETAYGWNVPSYLILFALSSIVIGFSFSPYIASRLLIIRITLVLFLPGLLLPFVYDFSFESRNVNISEVYIGFTLNYAATFLTIVYGIIHFVTSYRTFKRMMKQEGMNESDLLDQ